MKSNLLKRRRKSKLAVSAIMGSILMVAVTLAVGFAAWAWARGAAQSSENSFGNAISSNLNYLKENFLIANVNFSATNTQNVSIWFYNSGNTTVYIKQIFISNVTSTSPWTNSTTKLSSVNTQGCGYCLKLPIGQVTLAQFKVNKPFVSTVIYQFKALGQYGNIYTYQQAR